jgi:hypothetical protein
MSITLHQVAFMVLIIAANFGLSFATATLSQKLK